MKKIGLFLTTFIVVMSMAFMVMSCDDDSGSSTTTTTKYAVTFNKNTTDTVTNMPQAQSVVKNAKATDPNPAVGGVYSNPPVRTGFVFAGWFKAANTTVPFIFANETITGDTEVFAKWTDESGNTMFDVTFAANAGTDNVTNLPVKQSIASGQKVVDPASLQDYAVPARSGFTFTGWYKEPAATTAWNFATDTVIGITTLYAGWINPDLYWIANFYLSENDTAPYATKSVLKTAADKKIEAPDDPDDSLAPSIVEGFDVWVDDEGEEFDFEVELSSNVDIFATWKVTKYLVTYMYNSTKLGEVAVPKTGEAGYKALVPYPDFAPDVINEAGKGIHGWHATSSSGTYTEATGFPFTTEITDDTTIYAVLGNLFVPGTPAMTTDKFGDVLTIENPQMEAFGGAVYNYVTGQVRVGGGGQQMAYKFPDNFQTEFSNVQIWYEYLPHGFSVGQQADWTSGYGIQVILKMYDSNDDVATLSSGDKYPWLDKISNPVTYPLSMAAFTDGYACEWNPDNKGTTNTAVFSIRVTKAIFYNVSKAEPLIIIGDGGVMNKSTNSYLTTLDGVDVIDSGARSTWQDVNFPITLPSTVDIEQYSKARIKVIMYNGDTQLATNADSYSNFYLGYKAGYNQAGLSTGWAAKPDMTATPLDKWFINNARVINGTSQGIVVTSASDDTYKTLQPNIAMFTLGENTSTNPTTSCTRFIITYLELYN